MLQRLRRLAAAPVAGLACASAAAALLGCANRVWSGDELAARFPELAAHPGHRLVELHPYVLPFDAEVWLFTCRWTTEAPVGVWISAAFEEAEREVVRGALRAWEGAGLGIRFGEVRADEASIHIERAEEPVERAAGPGAGRAVVDCALDLTGSYSTERLPASLVAARVELAFGAGEDALGRPRAHPPEELLGAALHELGHALGFQGHAVRGETILRRMPETVRARAARVLAGEPFADATLAALYALPSGSVLARVPVDAWRTNLVDRMAVTASRAGLAGPFVRVGDAAARVWWREETGRRDEYGLSVVNLAETYADPDRMLVIAEPLTRRALPRSRDRGPR